MKKITQITILKRQHLGHKTQERLQKKKIYIRSEEDSQIMPQIKDEQQKKTVNQKKERKMV